MSVLQQGVALRGGSTVRWAGYALVVAGTAAALAKVFQPGPIWSTTVLVIAISALVVIAKAPEVFETTWRGGARRLNPLIGAPAALLFLVELPAQVDAVTLPLAAAALGAAALLLVSIRGSSRPGLASPISFQITLTIFGAALGYGGVVAADVDYDRSPPAIVPVQVLDKFATHGRSSTTYHLRVPPFASRKALSSLTVSYATYSALRPGDLVCVLEHRGAIGLPWVTARLCAR
jgi:hypothetical protein